jgi:hypothetical protein
MGTKDQQTYQESYVTWIVGNKISKAKTPLSTSSILSGFSGYG